MSRNGVVELMPAPLTTMSTRAEQGQHRRQQPLQLRLVGRFRGLKVAPPARRRDPLEPRRRLGLVAADQHDLRPGRGQALRHRPAEFAGAAHHHGHLAFQGEQGF